MFPRELIDKWMLDSSHGGLLSDRLIIAGSDDPLLYRIVLDYAASTGAYALISCSPTGTQLGLNLLESRRVDVCGIHWGPDSESHIRHPALIQQHSEANNWVLIHAFRREQGLINFRMLGQIPVQLAESAENAEHGEQADRQQRDQLNQRLEGDRNHQPAMFFAQADVPGTEKNREQSDSDAKHQRNQLLLGFVGHDLQRIGHRLNLQRHIRQGAGQHQ